MVNFIGSTLIWMLIIFIASAIYYVARREHRIQYPQDYYKYRFATVVNDMKDLINVGEATPRKGLYQNDFRTREHLMACLVEMEFMDGNNSWPGVSDFARSKEKVRAMLDLIGGLQVKGKIQSREGDGTVMQAQNGEPIQMKESDNTKTSPKGEDQSPMKDYDIICTPRSSEESETDRK